MSNFVCPEISKTIYELTRWTRRQDRFYLVHIDCPDDILSVVRPKLHRNENDYINGYRTYVPAYELGFLLRKLTPVSDRNVKLWYSVFGRYWCCQLVGLGGPTMADTPEDAVAKLVVRLVKEGSLL